MSRPIILQSTLDTIDHAWLSLGYRHCRSEWLGPNYREASGTPTLSAVRRNLLILNDHLANLERQDFRQAAEDRPSIEWLFYDDEQEVIPIYDEALALVSRNLIVPVREIPHVLAFMGVPGTSSGIDVENHDGKGYHFHYGKVKNDALIRYDVLLTFDKHNVGEDKQAIPDIPLYIEPHAAGKCSHIDASAIGHNRRLPIYLVCVKAMKSRRLENFLTPSSNSWQFYPAV